MAVRSRRSLARRSGGRGDGVVALLRIDALALRDERGDDVVQVRPVEARDAADVEDLERVEPPRAGGHDAGQGDVVVGIGDGSQRLLEIADLRRGEQAQPADDGVRDVLVAQPRDDRLAVLVLAVEDGGVRPVRVLAEPLANAIDDGDGLVLGTAAHDDPDIEAFGPFGSETLVRFESRGVASDEPIRRIEHATHRSEVLLDPPARWRAGWHRVRVVLRRSAEASVELGEGGEARAAESVDRLVVVADDHDVVRPVRRPRRAAR